MSNSKTEKADFLSEEDYYGLIETLYLSTNPRVRDELIEGLNTPIADCVPEDKVVW